MSYNTPPRILSDLIHVERGIIATVDHLPGDCAELPEETVESYGDALHVLHVLWAELSDAIEEGSPCTWGPVLAALAPDLEQAQRRRDTGNQAPGIAPPDPERPSEDALRVALVDGAPEAIRPMMVTLLLAATSRGVGAPPTEVLVGGVLAAGGALGSQSAGPVDELAQARARITQAVAELDALPPVDVAMPTLAAMARQGSGPVPLPLWTTDDCPYCADGRIRCGGCDGGNDGQGWDCPRCHGTGEERCPDCAPRSA